MTLIGYILVFLGAGIGGALRHAVNRASTPLDSGWPWPTFTVNIVGGLAMGILTGWFAFRVGGAHHLHSFTTTVRGQHLRLFLTTGVLGGFTTFSAFSLETVLLLERGRIALAAGYAAGSVLLAVGALFLGVALMRP